MAEPTASQRTELRRLTSVQRRIWASQRLHPDVPLANMGDPVRLRGSIDPERLIAAFDTVVRRSDVLRSVVVDEASVVVLDRPPAPTRVLEVAAADRDDWMAARVATPIDATACVYDSALLRHAEDDWTWWLCIHHVAVDASAAELVLRATAAAYDHDGDPSDADLSGVIEPTFFDHVDPGDAAAVPARGATPEPITLGVAPGPASTRSERRRIDLDTATDESLRTALAGPLRSISRDLGLLAIAAVVVAGIVHRLDGRRQIVVGVPLHHRMRKSDRRLLGPLMEFAPLAVDIDPDEPRGECFTRTVGAIVQLLRTRRSSGGGAQSFDTIVNVIGAGAPTFGGVVAERSWVRSDHDDPTQRLGVQVRVDPDDTTSWLLDIDPGLAPDSVRERLAGWFRSELVALCDAPQRPLRDSSLLLADDEATSAELAALAPSPSPLELDELVHETVRNSLRTRPDEWVIEHGDRVLTAWEFDEAAERIAAWLVAGGLSVGDRVGLEFDRGLDVVVAVQAVLRAGGAFVVLDPEDPLSRRRRIADEAGVSIVLDRLPAADELAAVDAVALPTVGLDDLAYVLFTSGSTGEPKGVPVSHRGLADYLRFAADAYVDPASPPVLALHSKLRFDLTITSLFLALATDGRTIVVDGDAAEALRTVAADERVTFLKATPSQLDLYRRFVVGRSCVDTLVVGGEAFRTSTADDVSAVCAPAVRVFNEYGPTEAVVGCMVHEYDPSIDRGTDVPIGRACDGAQLVVLDRVGQLAPVGVWGELYVRRPGQPSAYLGDPSRSAGWFVSLDSVDGLERVVPGGHVGSWYRTGDRARIVRTGVLVYGGRSDDQLKVNGIRLEPGEVEAAMTEHPAVSVAVVRADASGRQLVAWWQPTSDAASADPGELRAFLADRLPRHAIPTTYVRVEAMPLAASAKVDVDGLPAPSVADRAVGAGVPLATPTERAVARVWADVLDLARAVEHVEIGATDDLRDLGASSLTLLEAVAALEDEFGIRLPIAEAVTCRTVRSLAALVDAVGVDGGHARYGRAELDEPEPDAALPLSPAEEALLFEYRSDPLDVRYHGGRIVVLDDVVEPDRIERALADVVAHHQPLHVAYDRNRTALDVADALEVERCDPMSIGAFRDRVAEVRRRPFDLDRGPLVRALIAPLADGGTAVFVGKHHINGDAGTFDVLWRHVGRRLAGDDLPELRPSYAAHLRAQRLRHADADDAGRRHWRGLLAARGESSTVGLAAPDSPEPDGYLTVDASPTPERIAATGASAFVTAATALATTLSAYGTSDRADFSVAVSTRDLSAASEVVGNYLNTVPMWLDVNGGATLGSLRDDVADQTAAALAHRTVPFATIVRDSREAGLDGPVASVLLVADRAAPLELAGVRAQQEAVLSGDAVTDLTFFVRERGAGSPVELSLEYRGSVVAADDARRLLATFRAAFERLVDEPDTPAGAIGAAESAPDLVGDRLADHDLVLARWLRHAASEPGTPAVVDGEVNSLTHGELLARARQIADEVVSAVGSGSTCERLVVIRESVSDQIGRGLRC
ncbi:MAG: AMP-binding protein, partial [Actinomycetota bacterium]